MQAQLHARTQQADVGGDADREIERRGKEEIKEKEGTMTWKVDFPMSKVKSMVLSAVFLLSPPPPCLPPLSPVEISHFLQAQC